MTVKQKQVCKSLKIYIANGVITKQQYKTLKGQVLAGDIEGALKGLKTILMRVENQKQGVGV